MGNGASVSGPPAPGGDRERRRARRIVVASVVAFVLTASVLVGVLVAAAVRAREKARMSSCLSNLKSIGLLQHMYAEDHGDMLPPADAWCDDTLPYASTQLEHACPSAPQSPWGYAMNSALSGASEAEIPSPGETILAYDSTTGTKNANDLLTSLPVPGRHLDGNVYVFADAHAKWFADSEAPRTASP